jgi:predicted ArsR family transcriptional regulator
MTATTLQEQARALGDPTRHAVFRYVADADHPVDVAELTARFGFNHNAIRQHLAKLVHAGLVAEDRAPPAGRGRPRLVSRVDPSADGRWGVAGPYERLSLLLAEIIRTGDSAVEVGRRSVRHDRRHATAETEDPVALIADSTDHDGFAPSVRTRGSRVELVLGTCPFATAALADPDTVCALHLGIAKGVADLTQGRLVVDELVPHDPRRANCRLRLHLEPEAQG